MIMQVYLHGAAFWKKAKEPVVASHPALEPQIVTQNSLPEGIKEDESSNHDAAPVCEDLEEELNLLLHLLQVATRQAHLIHFWYMARNGKYYRGA